MSLAGIGALAGGLSQGLQPYFQQMMQNPGSSDLGAALMSIYGGGQQQGQGGQQQGIGALMAPPVQQQAQAPQQPPQAPPMQAPQAPTQIPNQPPTGQARAPLAAPPPQQMAQAAPAQLPPKAPPPMPMTAQPGTGVGAGASPMPSPVQPPGGGTAALAGQPQTQAPPPQQQMQRGPAPQLQPGQTFDFDRLAGALARTPGMTPQKMGRIVTSPAFTRLLNVQGLQQYRALQGQLGRERVQQGYERLGQGEERLGQGQEKIDASKGWRQYGADTKKFGQANKSFDEEIRIARENRDAKVKEALGDPNVDDKKAVYEAADKEFNDKVADVEKRRKGLKEPTEPSAESASGGGDASAIEEAKAAIAAGAPRDAVIKRLQEHGIDASGSGL